MSRLMPQICVAFIIALLLRISFSYEIPTFTNYPPLAEFCLSDAAQGSGCEPISETPQQMNSCLCSNGGGFFALAAQCIQAYDSEDLQSVYSIAVFNCDQTLTPITISLDQFMAFAGGSVSLPVTSISTSQTSTFHTSTTAAAAAQQTGISTSSPTPAASASSGNSKGGLSKSDVIALAVGIPGTVFTIIGVLIMCCR
jgi:hypothetical protein